MQMDLLRNELEDTLYLNWRGFLFPDTLRLERRSTQQCWRIRCCRDLSSEVQLESEKQRQVAELDARMQTFGSEIQETGDASG